MKTRTWGTWASDKLMSFISSTEYLYDSIIDKISTVFSYDYVKKFISQLFEGSTTIVDARNVVHLPKSRNILLWESSLKVNALSYLSVVALTEIVKKMIRENLLETSGNPFSYGTALSMLTFLTCSEAIIASHRQIDNKALNLALIKKLEEENQISRYFPSCKHDQGALIEASAFSPIYLATDVVSVWILSCIPLIGWLAPMGNAFVYGQSLAELSYAAAGNCTEDRSKELAKVNGYSLGLGATLYGVQSLLAYLVKRYVGVNGVFVTNAIHSLIYPYFVTASLLRDRPLDRHENGIELFYFQRYIANHFVKISGNKLESLMNGNDSDFDCEQFYNQALACRPVYWTSKILSKDVYGRWDSKDNFIMNTPIKLFMQSYYPMIRNKIDEIINLQDRPLIKTPIKDLPKACLGPIIPKLPDKMTRLVGVTDEQKKVITAVYSESIKGPLRSLQKFLEDIYVRQQQSNIVPTKKEKQLALIKKTTSANESEISSTTQNNREEIKEVPNQTEIKHQFLLKLKQYAYEAKWDYKGRKYLFSFVPENISKLREILKVLHEKSTEKEVLNFFQDVYNLFMFYDKNPWRDKEVQEFYESIVDKIEDIIKNDFNPKLVKK